MLGSAKRKMFSIIFSYAIFFSIFSLFISFFQSNSMGLQNKRVQKKIQEPLNSSTELLFYDIPNNVSPKFSTDIDLIIIGMSIRNGGYHLERVARNILEDPVSFTFQSNQLYIISFTHYGDVLPADLYVYVEEMNI